MRTPVDTEHITRVIASVPGVLQARVIADTSGKGRLRIRVAPGDHESVAWAVAATLRERFGIALDPAAFRTPPSGSTGAASDGEPEDTTAAAPPASENVRDPLQGLEDHVTARLDQPYRPTEPDAVMEPERYRAAIGELITQQGQGAVSVTATLQHDGREARAAAAGLATSRGRWRAVAEATVGALRDLTGGRLAAAIDRVTVATAEEPPTARVVVTVLSPRGEERLLGASLVRDDPERAVMRATLDALNRRIEPWLRVAEPV